MRKLSGTPQTVLFFETEVPSDQMHDEDRAEKRWLCRKFQARIKVTQMRWVFATWAGILERKKAGLARVRTCVAAKRIAFSAFKRWYGNNLDDSVQMVRTSSDTSGSRPAKYPYDRNLKYPYDRNLTGL
jgi:hypothetical protein